MKEEIDLGVAVFIALGKASMCWTPPPTFEVFDSMKIIEIGEELVKFINKNYVIRNRV